MTPLSPYPPEMPGASAVRVPGGAALPQVAAPAGTGLDFAGLLGAALPAPALRLPLPPETRLVAANGLAESVPETGVPASGMPGLEVWDTALAGCAVSDAGDPAMLPLTGPLPPSSLLASPPAPRQPPLRSLTIAAPTPLLPGGTILPEAGAQLPQPVPVPASGSVPVPLKSAQKLDLAHPLPLHPPTASPEAPIGVWDRSGSAPLREDDGTLVVPDPAQPAFAPAILDAPIAAPTPPPATLGMPLAQSEPEVGSPVAGSSATAPEASDLPLIDAFPAEPALPTDLVPVAVTAPPTAPVRTPLVAPASTGTRGAPAIRRVDAPLHVAEVEPEPEPEPKPTTPAVESSPAATAFELPLTAQATSASAAGPDLSASASQPAPAFAPPLVAPATTPDRIDPLRAPAPQQETSIAQVETLREAARMARPELTLRHAEFGAVSLRLEATGTEGWRAVLASRDPGFVPAIQAALADRAVAAAASASTDSGAFSGQNAGQHPGQNGTSDHRYAASPNGGQAGSQPYLGHSAQRDGEAAPDHRRPSTAAALAARAEEGEEAAGSPARQTRGMFA